MGDTGRYALEHTMAVTAVPGLNLKTTATICTGICSSFLSWNFTILNTPFAILRRGKMSGVPILLDKGYIFITPSGMRLLPKKQATVLICIPCQYRGQNLLAIL